MPSQIIYKKYITRSDVKNSSNIFIFGDNDQRSGYGGQAREMRGEPNAIGIRVKKYPSMSNDAFYTDTEYDENIKKINEDIINIERMSCNRAIVFPSDGIGTGMAKLNITAPRTFNYLVSTLKEKFNIINKIR